ncbi:DNA-3-methyladenine glycosylase I [Haloechinothrix aidingensis]|uniref:DNA-3-methyladenine glycosylase I n=1 Tax=Haloechinothrix aidingensis TaxID=2752311 RepID=UPI0031B5904A
MSDAQALVTAEDDVPRCPWANTAPDYAEYHDTEWGVPLTGEIAMFERLCLESFQSGLSWLVILRKREAFRRAFAGFDPARVAEFDSDDVERLLTDADIVRNRAKIEAVIANARLIPGLEMALDDLLWSFAPAPGEHTRPSDISEVPATSDASRAMARELKRRGFSFVGPTTCYALMQATGMVDDHVADCWLAS